MKQGKKMAGLFTRRCPAVATHRAEVYHCDLIRGHIGNHAAERGMYWIAWSKGTWTEGDDEEL